MGGKAKILTMLILGMVRGGEREHLLLSSNDLLFVRELHSNEEGKLTDMHECKTVYIILECSFCKRFYVGPMIF